MNVEEGISAVQKLINTSIELSVNYGFQVLGAVIVLIIGAMAANWVQKLLLKIFEKKQFDITLSRFIAGMVRIAILGFVIIIALGKFGITIAPLIAVLGAAAFGATYAIQGPLSNYGAGVSIILGRPFVVGDTITVAGVSGLVTEVKLACTILTDEDGVKITIPNKHVVGEILYNSKKSKVVEGVIGISYDNDPEVAVGLIQTVLKQNSEVAQEPGPQVGIQQFADSSINIGFRYWVPTTSYYKNSHIVNSAVYKILTQNGIKIPYPQRDIHIIGQEAKSNFSA